MKSGTRALGIAESYGGAADGGRSGDDSDRSTVFCGAVVRASRVADGFVFGTATVGGTDATATMRDMVERLDRADVRHVFVAGVAPAWFNVVDLRALREAVGRPVVSVSFEGSPGLEPALREQFSGDALDERLAVYRRQPDRRALSVNGETVYVRACGADAEDASEVVRGFTPEGGRPEPLRVARLGARAARAWSAAGQAI